MKENIIDDKMARRRPAYLLYFEDCLELFFLGELGNDFELLLFLRSEEMEDGGGGTEIPLTTYFSDLFGMHLLGKWEMIESTAGFMMILPNFLDLVNFEEEDLCNPFSEHVSVSSEVVVVTLQVSEDGRLNGLTLKSGDGGGRGCGGGDAMGKSFGFVLGADIFIVEKIT